MARPTVALPTDLELLYAYLEEVETDLEFVRGAGAATALAQMHRLRLEIARQIEMCEELARVGKTAMPEEEFLEALEADAREMPDAHLRPFAEEYARRHGSTLPPVVRPP